MNTKVNCEIQYWVWLVLCMWPIECMIWLASFSGHDYFSMSATLKNRSGLGTTTIWDISSLSISKGRSVFLSFLIARFMVALTLLDIQFSRCGDFSNGNDNRHTTSSLYPLSMHMSPGNNRETITLTVQHVQSKS